MCEKPENKRKYKAQVIMVFAFGALNTRRQRKPVVCLAPLSFRHFATRSGTASLLVTAFQKCFCVLLCFRLLATSELILHLHLTYGCPTSLSHYQCCPTSCKFVNEKKAAFLGQVFCWDNKSYLTQINTSRIKPMTRTPECHTTRYPLPVFLSISGRSL